MELGSRLVQNNLNPKENPIDIRIIKRKNLLERNVKVIRKRAKKQKEDKQNDKGDLYKRKRAKTRQKKQTILQRYH